MEGTWQRLVESTSLLHIGRCVGFGWGRAHFLHSSYYKAMFWICAENTVDSTGLVQLLLSSACTESRPFLLFTPPHQRVGWGCTRSWEGAQLGQLTPADPRDIRYDMTSCSTINQGEGCLGDQLLGDWLGIVVWWWAIVFICISCLSWVLFLSLWYFPFHDNLLLLLQLLNGSYLNPRVFSLLPFQFTSSPSFLEGDWGSGCVVLSCQLGLNHDSRAKVKVLHIMETLGCCFSCSLLFVL